MENKTELLEKYNNIKNPKELMEFMDQYIQYGMVDKDGRVYKWEDADYQKACVDKWYLKSTEDIIKTGYAHCWDQTELERDWFKKNNYEFKTIFVIFLHNTKYPYVCHSYLIYKDKNTNTWNWFEHADYQNRGIHSFDSAEKCILAQRCSHIEFNKSIGYPVDEEIINCLHMYEYQKPKEKCNNKEYFDNIFSEKSIDITNNILQYRKDRLDEYINQDINNPKYLFHGSPKKLDVINPMLSHASDNNLNNIAQAVFLFPSFLKSTPYAFKDSIKKLSSDLKWYFDITNDNDYPLMYMENVNIEDDMMGYIYVFTKNDKMIKDDKSYQYKCYTPLTFCDVVEIYFKDYKKYYEINNTKRR